MPATTIVERPPSKYSFAWERIHHSRTDQHSSTPRCVGKSSCKMTPKTDCADAGGAWYCTWQAKYHYVLKVKCVASAATCDANTCGGNGQCALDNGLPKCTCNEGYLGSDCRTAPAFSSNRFVDGTLTSAGAIDASGGSSGGGVQPGDEGSIQAPTTITKRTRAKINLLGYSPLSATKGLELDQSFAATEEKQFIEGIAMFMRVAKSQVTIHGSEAVNGAGQGLPDARFRRRVLLSTIATAVDFSIAASDEDSAKGYLGQLKYADAGDLGSRLRKKGMSLLESATVATESLAVEDASSGGGSSNGNGFGMSTGTVVAIAASVGFVAIVAVAMVVRATSSGTAKANADLGTNELVVSSPMGVGKVF